MTQFRYCLTPTGSSLISLLCFISLHRIWNIDIVYYIPDGLSSPFYKILAKNGFGTYLRQIGHVALHRVPKNS